MEYDCKLGFRTGVGSGDIIEYSLQKISGIKKDRYKCPIAECTLNFDIRWINSNINKWVAREVMTVPRRGDVPEALAQLLVFELSDNISRIQLDFSRNCNKKYELASKLFEIWRSRSPGLPSIYPAE